MNSKARLHYLTVVRAFEMVKPMAERELRLATWFPHQRLAAAETLKSLVLTYQHCQRYRDAERHKGGRATSTISVIENTIIRLVGRLTTRCDEFDEMVGEFPRGVTIVDGIDGASAVNQNVHQLIWRTHNGEVVLAK